LQTAEAEEWMHRDNRKIKPGAAADREAACSARPCAHIADAKKKNRPAGPCGEALVNPS
jgi:hypothetical protein